MAHFAPRWIASVCPVDLKRSPPSVRAIQSSADPLATMLPDGGLQRGRVIGCDGPAAVSLPKPTTAIRPAATFPSVGTIAISVCVDPLRLMTVACPAISPPVGADITVGVGSNLTLEATVNPDFGQIDADPAEVLYLREGGSGPEADLVEALVPSGHYFDRDPETNATWVAPIDPAGAASRAFSASSVWLGAPANPGPHMPASRPFTSTGGR